MYVFDKEQSNKLIQFIYDTKFGNKVINGLLDKLNEKEKQMIEKSVNEEYIRNNPLEIFDEELEIIKEDEYEDVRRQLEELSSKIRKQYGCKNCGSIHDGNGVCRACRNENKELQEDIKNLNKLLFRLPDNFFEKNTIDPTLTKLYHLQPMKINKVNELIYKCNYDIAVLSKLMNLKSEKNDVLNNKTHLTKSDYDFIIETLMYDEISKDHLNIKYLLLDYCMKAAIEKNENFNVTQEEFENIFRKMAEKISKEEADAFKVEVEFVEKDKMKECDGQYIDLFSKVNINKDTLISNPIEGLSTIYHEIIHQWQDVELNKKKKIDSTTFIQIMDYVNRKVIGEKYYKDNYEWIFSELQAHLNQNPKTFDYLKRINVEVPKDYLEKSQILQNHFNEYIEKGIYLYRKKDDQWYSVNYLFDQNIYNHPEYFDKFPQLSMFYKKDDNHIIHKSIDELENDYDNFKNGLLSLNGNPDIINQMYELEFNSLKDTKKKISDEIDEKIKQMEQGIDIDNNQPISNRQKGYTMIGILGLITCIVSIGIIIYSYIYFYK